MSQSHREAVELVRAMSVDRSRQGRFKANSIKTPFDKIKNQILRVREEPADSDSDGTKEDDVYRRKYESNVRQSSI